MLVEGKLGNEKVKIDIEYEEARRIFDIIRHDYNKEDVVTVLEEMEIEEYDEQMFSEILDIYEDKLVESGVWCDIALSAVNEYLEKYKN